MSALPPWFQKWCQKFDDVFKTKAEKKGFRLGFGGIIRRKSRPKYCSNYRQYYRLFIEPLSVSLDAVCAFGFRPQPEEVVEIQEREWGKSG
ncbi:hypothetical protein [Okeania sp. SIO2C2]|uniref:hypothetical protein n=1 Tax=Okeania sp. SIO2C2 TaxID=2607787 RepID=UPI00257C8520|nr:hypothetical protein [Okeania sp. SIO2C2]